MKLTEPELLTALLVPETRAVLLATLERGGESISATDYFYLAYNASISAERVRQIVEGLLETGADDEWLEPFLLHRNVSEEVLFEVYARGRGIDILGHRAGPRALLEKIAATFHHSEAITTLALDYYGADKADEQAFADFIAAHKENWMLRENIEHAEYSPQLSARKRALALSVLGERMNLLKP